MCIGDVRRICFSLSLLNFRLYIYTVRVLFFNLNWIILCLLGSKASSSCQCLRWPCWLLLAGSCITSQSTASGQDLGPRTRTPRPEPRPGPPDRRTKDSTLTWNTSLPWSETPKTWIKPWDLNTRPEDLKPDPRPEDLRAESRPQARHKHQDQVVNPKETSLLGLAQNSLLLWLLVYPRFGLSSTATQKTF